MPLGPLDNEPIPPPQDPAPWEDTFSAYDFAENASERDLIYHDLASDSDDFARSAEEGWYDSDED